MEPQPYETMSEGRVRGAKRSGSGLMAALAGGLMIVGVVTLALIGTVAFRSFSTPDEADRSAAARAPAQVPRTVSGDGGAVAAPQRQSVDADAAARAAAERALAENLNRKAAAAQAAAAQAAPAPLPAPAPAAATPPAQIASAPAAPQPLAAPAVPPQSVVSSAESRAHVTRAAGMFRDGDVSGARLLLDRAVRGGDPTAAFALAETWDPNILAALNVRGVKGDKDKARALYAQALQGGLGEARGRLAALGQ